MSDELDISSWSTEDQELYMELSQKVRYYDQLQYIFKIKLNSLYGALLNKHFRFYDERLGESTTGTGRAILRFQCSKVNDLLVGAQDPEGEAIYYGDTDSTYFNALAGSDVSNMSQAEKEELAVERADWVADQVNDAYPAFMREAFLCTEEYDKEVKCAREVVSPKGIFVTKKRYVLWVTNLDGRPCDYLKVMGLDTKKTILPRYIQDALNGYIERFLKGTDWDTIAKDVVSFKDELAKRKFIELGIPKGINKVETYTQNYEMDENTRLPGHVRASILFNQMLDEHGDTATMRVTSGMRVLLFYLARPMGKFKSIAIPADEEWIPEWFSEMNISIETQIQKLVDDPLKNILKAIDRESPSHQTLFEATVVEF